MNCIIVGLIFLFCLLEISSFSIEEDQNILVNSLENGKNYLAIYYKKENDQIFFTVKDWQLKPNQIVELNMFLGSSGMYGKSISNQDPEVLHLPFTAEYLLKLQWDNWNSIFTFLQWKNESYWNSISSGSCHYIKTSIKPVLIHCIINKIEDIPTNLVVGYFKIIQNFKQTKDNQLLSIITVGPDNVIEKGNTPIKLNSCWNFPLIKQSEFELINKETNGTNLTISTGNLQSNPYYDKPLFIGLVAAIGSFILILIIVSGFVLKFYFRRANKQEQHKENSTDLELSGTIKQTSNDVGRDSVDSIQNLEYSASTLVPRTSNKTSLQRTSSSIRNLRRKDEEELAYQSSDQENAENKKNEKKISKNEDNDSSTSNESDSN